MMRLSRLASLLFLPIGLSAATVEHRIASLSPEEQAYVERINRARANPLAEAERMRNTQDRRILDAYDHFDVDLEWFLHQPLHGMARFSPVPPLVPRATLTAAARRHSRDMFTHTFQSHTGSDGSNPATRATAAGYSFGVVLENVFTGSLDVDHGHHAFMVDWGVGPHGIQDPPRHRTAILDPRIRDVGIGVVEGHRERIESGLPNTRDVGPQTVTQLFARPMESLPVITGVIHYDLDGNGFYDPGEGIGGVRIDVPEAGSFALSTPSGGYGVEVPDDGRWNIRFSGPGLDPVNFDVEVQGGRNVKQDLVPVYSPEVRGPASIPVGWESRFAVPPMPGADGYEARSFRLDPLDSIDPGLEELDPDRSEISDAYDPVDRDVHSRRSTRAFHLAHPEFASQHLTLRKSILPGPVASLEFMSWMGLATSNQIARVEASTNEGLDWNPLWSRAGTTLDGRCLDSNFARVRVDLAPFAGETLLLRFNFIVQAGSYYPLKESPVCKYGWYFDSLRFTGAQTTTTPSPHPVNDAGEFSFLPELEGDWKLQARIRLSDRWLPYGPVTSVEAQEGILIRITSISLEGDWVRIRFEATDGTDAFTLLTAPAPIGPWGEETTVEFGLDGTLFTARTPRGNSSAAFYRIRQN